MAQLFDIQKVTIGPKNLEAQISVAPSAPLRTSDDLDGTALVVDLMPGLLDHLCLGDASSRFGDVIEDTELAHLLEHVTVELLARTDIAGDISSGQTVQTGERSYKITLACPDDVLVAGALSSAVWVLQWAYSGGGEPEPDIDAIASGLVDLVGSLDEGVSGEPVQLDEQPAEEPEPAPAEPGPAEPEPAPAEPGPAEPEPAPEPLPEEPPAEGASIDEPAPEEPQDPWALGGVPKPHLVR